MMASQHNDDFDSPLDPLLENLPTEAPPADLRQRCLDAVAGAERRRVRARWSGWRTVGTLAAAVAGLLIVVAVMSPMFFFPAKRSEPIESAMPPAVVGSAPSARAAEGGPPAMGGEGGPMGSTAHWAAKTATKGKGGAGYSDSDARLGVPGGMAASAKAPEPGGAYTEEAAPAHPWRDNSGERQKEISKTLSVEVEKVEEAHDRATSIITKANGYVLSERLQAGEGGSSEAHLTARVPVDRLDGVVAQLRELGKVLELHGEAQDRTRDYNSRGAGIREMGAGEDELVAKYEKETNPTRKQALYEQILQLRQDNQQHKGALQDLSERTHYALLELTLTERTGPKEYLQRTLARTATLAGWVLATAVIWLPLLVIALVLWRRLGRRSVT